MKFDDFAITQILREIKYWQIQTVQKVIYVKFRVWNCPKWHLWTVWIHQNLISRKIGVAVKWSNVNKVKPFWKFLEQSATHNFFQKTLFIFNNNRIWKGFKFFFNILIADLKGAKFWQDLTNVFQWHYFDIGRQSQIAAKKLNRFWSFRGAKLIKIWLFYPEVLWRFI